MKYSNLAHAFAENMKLLSIHLSKCSDGLVVILFGSRSHIIGLNLIFFYIIVKCMHSFFFFLY